MVIVAAIMQLAVSFVAAEVKDLASREECRMNR
jgi:hypothetical protein